MRSGLEARGHGRDWIAVAPPRRQPASAKEVLGRRLFSVDFLATLSGEMLVTLIYHRNLDSDWERAARELASELGIGIIGRSKGQKVVLDRD